MIRKSLFFGLLLSLTSAALLFPGWDDANSAYSKRLMINSITPVTGGVSYDIVFSDSCPTATYNGNFLTTTTSAPEKRY